MREAGPAPVSLSVLGQSASDSLPVLKQSIPVPPGAARR
jgi:hypothetical protein